MTNEEITGRAKGGAARAAKLPAERKAEIAQKAAIARWGAKATHKGNFKDKLGIDVECYVIDDSQKSAVISQTGMAAALGLSPRGNALPRFLANKAMAASVSAELKEKINNPLKFQYSNASAGIPPAVVHGFDSAILIDICNAIISSEKQLGDRYANIIKQAHLIVGASAKSGIRDLVYALAGYNPTTEEVIAAFKLYVLEEAKKYEPEFPSELYVQWHRIYNIPVPERGKPWNFKHLTVKHIYFPLAKSSGKIYELLKALKSRDGDRGKKLFQFLNEVAESSNDQATYERKIIERFGGQQELDLVVPKIPSAS
jgi:hypothetical protein